MATINLPPDFKGFLGLLNAHQVEYLLIGGYAVAYDGYPYLFSGAGSRVGEMGCIRLHDLGYC